MSQQLNAYVHPSAIVDEGVTLGDGTKVWHFTHISKGAKIGSRCSLGQNVYIGPGVTVGNGVKIQNNVSVYQGVSVEDDVFLGPSCVLTNVFNPRSPVERKDEFRLTHIRKGATIGANATIVCGHTLGEFSFIGAGAVVTRDVMAYSIVYGSPARHQGWMCVCGEPLRNTGNVECPACRSAYAITEQSCRPQT